MEARRTSNRAQNIILFSVAILFTLVIFFIDLNVPQSIAFGAVYSMIILYSWLLPGKNTMIYAGIVCTVLVITSLVKSNSPENHNSLEVVNAIISIIVIWICVTLVAAAKRGYEGLEKVLEKLEDKVFERTKDLELKNKELEQFTYIASHDLQEPLRTVTSFAELLATNYSQHLDENGKKGIQYMLKATERMKNLIKGLLDYSRIGSDTAMKNVDCNMMLTEIMEDLATAMKANQADITIGNLPKDIKAHDLELRQLFQNLITNALKFKKDGVQPKIHISSSEKNNYRLFSVKDNGIGIAKEHRKKIFKIFQRLHTASKFSGTGIGLAHCQKIVELHRGKIWVESEVGIGSTFYFSIPA